LGTAVALALTNHWYMTFRGLRRLRVPLRGYAWRIVLPCLLAFGILAGGLLAVRAMIHNSSALIKTVTISLFALLFFCIALWLLVLEPSQRTRVARFLGFAGRAQPLSPQPP
jgi:hypothetical protein